jgi:hypothetical protein
VKTIVIASLLAFAATPGTCRYCDYWDNVERTPYAEPVCDTRDCHEVRSGDTAHGTLLTLGWFECHIVATWLTEELPYWRFRTVVDLEDRDFFPLRDGITRIAGCWHRPPIMWLATDSRPDWPPFAHGDVFIPFHGESTLDGLVSASVEVERPSGCGGAAPPSVAVRLFEVDLHPSPEQREESEDERAAQRRRERAPTLARYEGLHPGDTFRWSGADATLVRIVSFAGRRTPWEVEGGWVEVRLAAAPL